MGNQQSGPGGGGPGEGGEKKKEETKKAAWGMYIDCYNDEYNTEEDDLAWGRPIFLSRVRPLL